MTHKHKRTCLFLYRLAALSTFAGLSACSHIAYDSSAEMDLPEAQASAADTSNPKTPAPDAPLRSANRASTPLFSNASAPIMPDMPAMREILREASEAELEKEAATPKNIWERIEQGYGFLEKNFEYNRRITSALDYYLDRGDHFQRSMENARPYLHYIVEEIERRDMPLELALLPIIESGFKPSAYSPKHAAGLWQFIPSTAKFFGLKSSWWYDGRRDVAASTNAALDYLQKLYKDMDGDWLKALAAYNCGENRVKRAVEENRRNGRPTDFWSLDLPRETRFYVPKLMAVSSIIAEPQLYGVELPQIMDQKTLRVVEVEGQIEVDVAARLAGISSKELRRLNPGIRRWATDPDGPHDLLLPIQNAEKFAKAIKHLSPRELAPTSIRKTAKHRIRRGDTLSGIAKRYGTSVKELCAMNNISRRTKLRLGGELVVSASAPQKLSMAKNSAGGKSSKKRRHRVRRGDTLWNIARHYRTDVSALLRLNGIKKNTVLAVGSKLLIP